MLLGVESLYKNIVFWPASGWPTEEKRIIVDESPMQLSVYTVSLRAFEALR
jgi:hypothetical protein